MEATKVFDRSQNYLVLLLVLLAASASFVGAEQVGFKQDMDEQQVAGASMRSKVNALPSGLTRFLFYSARPIERQAKIEGPFGGYKRSSSALDSLTGVTLGKRSSGSMELVNWEPLFARQYSMRSPPRMYDMRWAPLDSLDTPAHEQYN